jgi:hypothetical protein
MTITEGEAMMYGKCDGNASGAERSTVLWLKTEPGGHQPDRVLALCDHHSRRHADALSAAGFSIEAQNSDPSHTNETDAQQRAEETSVKDTADHRQ